MVRIFEDKVFEIIDYDAEEIPFRNIFERALGTEDLESLHVAWGATYDNQRDLLRRFRAACTPFQDEFLEIVKTYLDRYIVPEYGEILEYQREPTIRCNMAIRDEDRIAQSRDYMRFGPQYILERYYSGGKLPGLFHRDADYGLRLGAINLWIPITPAFDTNTLWIGERQERDAVSIRPVQVNPGQCLCFDGATRWHGNVLNLTDTTRVSFDLRIYTSQTIKYIV